LWRTTGKNKTATPAALAQAAPNMDSFEDKVQGMMKDSEKGAEDCATAAAVLLAATQQQQQQQQTDNPRPGTVQQVRIQAASSFSLHHVLGTRSIWNSAVFLICGGAGSLFSRTNAFKSRV
jgi:hypothetical protein